MFLNWPNPIDFKIWENTDQVFFTFINVKALTSNCGMMQVRTEFQQFTGQVNTSTMHLPKTVKGSECKELLDLTTCLGRPASDSKVGFQHLASGGTG